jgi:Cof subfamily protein (haloacid dehalogenase superfamily)
MSKILFLDVDGTLVDYTNRLPESAVKAVRLARSRGHRVYLCTGRSRAEVYPSLWEIGLDGMIGGNGSYVEHQGEVVMHQCLTAQACAEAVDWLHSRGLSFYLECNSALFASEDFASAGAAPLRAYMRRKDKAAADSVTVRDVFPDMIFGGGLYRSDVNKISYVLSSYQDYLDAQSAFPHLQHGTWGGAGETALFGDLGVKGITKAHAVEVLLGHLGADQGDTIAFGDAKVDIPLFRCCGFSVCMGSGGEEAKAAADYVTGDVDRDGLYQAFQHLGLIG